MKTENDDIGNASSKDIDLPKEAGRDKHLEGLSDDEKRMIRLMADIFVQSILNS